MDIDLVLVSMPAYTQKCPSLALASLATYLTEKNYKILAYDFGIPFFHHDIKKFRIVNPILDQLKLSPYPLWGISNWLGFENIITAADGKSLIKSLCPVCSELYNPIFSEFKEYYSLTRKILDRYAEELSNINTTVYGFSLTLGNAVSSLYVINKLKELKSNSIIIIGGPEASLYYRAHFYSQFKNIDFTIYHSEGEIPLERILAYLNGEIPKQNIPGICFKNQSDIRTTNLPPPLNLDQNLIPDYRLVEPKIPLRSNQVMDILISKGCQYNCHFCNEPLIWGSYRPKSPQKIFEEIKFYVEYYGVDSFELGDNSFSSSPYFLKALEQLSNSGITIQWGGNCRVNELNKDKLLEYHRFGLASCYFGVESASPKILKLMNKKIDLSTLTTLLKESHQNQIRSSLYFMVGFPGETSQDFQETLKFIESNSKLIDDITISVFSLMVNTPIFQSNLLTPIQSGPKILNSYTYQTKDGVTHEDRKKRFFQLHQIRKNLKI